VTHHPIVPREVTQGKLDRAFGGQHRAFRASSSDTTAERLEESAQTLCRAAVPSASRPALDATPSSTRCVNQAAHALQALGVRRGDVVALAMENRPAFFFAWMGLSKLAPRSLPSSTPMPVAECSRMPWPPPGPAA
jgi:fatty-acyl-CoA synthase